MVRNEHGHLDKTYAAVFDGMKASLYIDGTLASSKAVQGSVGVRMSELTVGREPPSGRYYFAGAIDEVAIYDKALSPPQLVHHHDTALGR